MANGTNNNDAINKSQLDALAGSVYSKTDADNRFYLNTTTLDAVEAPVANLSLNNYRIVSLADAVSASDAVTLSQLSTVQNNVYTKT